MWNLHVFMQKCMTRDNWDCQRKKTHVQKKTWHKDSIKCPRFAKHGTCWCMHETVMVIKHRWLSKNTRITGVVVVLIVWYLDLQLPVQSMPITTNVVSSNPTHAKVYSFQSFVKPMHTKYIWFKYSNIMKTRKYIKIFYTWHFVTWLFSEW